MILFVPDLLHHSRTVLETDLVCSSHLSSGSLAHAVEYLVEYINLLLIQRVFNGHTELVKLVRKLGGVNIALPIVVKYINHRYFVLSVFCKTNRPINKYSVDKVLPTARQSAIRW